MPARFRKVAAAAAVALPAVGYCYFKYRIPNTLSTIEDPVTQTTSVPFLRAAAFIDAHGSEWEVQKSNLTPTIGHAKGNKNKHGMELEILKMKVPFVVQQQPDVYAAYNADETAGDKRLFFSAVSHDAEKVTTNVHPMRLVAYLPNNRPKAVIQHIAHQYLRRRWDKNYMAFDKPFIDDSLTHPELFEGVRETEVVSAPNNNNNTNRIVQGLRNLDAKQLTSECEDVHHHLMTIPPSLRTPAAAVPSAQPKETTPLLGTRVGFTPVYNCWARHCVGSAALEKVKMRPREFLYEMLVSHKGLGSFEAANEKTLLRQKEEAVAGQATSQPTAAPVVKNKTGWGFGKKNNNIDACSDNLPHLESDDVYSIVYQCLPQCLLPSSAVKLPPSPIDVSYIEGGKTSVAGSKNPSSLSESAAGLVKGLDAAQLMTVRLHTAKRILEGMPFLKFRTAPVQMHYQELMVLPVWTSEDKERYIEFVRTCGGSIKSDLPRIQPPPKDPTTGRTPPCVGTLLFMTSCNDAQTPAAIPKWIERNLSMTMATGAYSMLAEGVKSY